MNVEETLEWAVDQGYTDMHMLIMFLVYEKKTLSLDDPGDKINYYLQDRFKPKMDEYLSSYKKKLNVRYKTNIFSIITQKGTYYALANSENEVMYLAKKYGFEIESAEMMTDDDYLMSLVDEKENETLITIKQLKERAAKVPSILGGFH